MPQHFLSSYLCLSVSSLPAWDILLTSSYCLQSNFLSQFPGSCCFFWSMCTASLTSLQAACNLTFSTLQLLQRYCVMTCTALGHPEVRLNAPTLPPIYPPFLSLSLHALKFPSVKCYVIVTPKFSTARMRERVSRIACTFLRCIPGLHFFLPCRLYTEVSCVFVHQC